MKQANKMVLLLFVISILAVSCSKNYYTSKAKGSDCGCPAKKGMVGY